MPLGAPDLRERPARRRTPRSAASYTRDVAFPKKLLNQNETLVLDLRPHWIQMVIPVVAFVAAFVLGIYLAVGLDLSGTANAVATVLAIVVILGTAAWLLWRYLVWSNTMFVLTSDRIITRRGVVSKSGVEIPLERVNTVFFRQGVLERLVGSGDLAIESAGERGNETLGNVRRPSVVQKEIYVQMEDNENRKFDRMRGGGPGGYGGWTDQGTVGGQQTQQTQHTQHTQHTQPTQPAQPGQGAPAGAMDATSVQPSITEQIEQLAQLHQRGYLSDAEYQAKKSELLSRM